MKKILVLSLLFFIPIIVKANNKIPVTLNKCVDGDTAWFIYDGKKEKFRFLAIDTPESTNKKEFYGKEASTYTCNKLQTAKKIEVEFDNKSTKTDKYNRYLAWVFVDGELLQEQLVENGYAEVKYLYDNYKYNDILKFKESLAVKNKLGIYSKKENYDYIYIIFSIIILFILLLNRKLRKKFFSKLKKAIKKELYKK